MKKKIYSSDGKHNLKYFVETQRNNMTPRAFFNHCRKLLHKAGNGAEGWLGDDDAYEHWSNNCIKYNITSYHEDWDEPKHEHMHSEPFHIQYFFQGSYNFILEFEFDDEKRGHGYMFAVEKFGSESSFI